MSCFSRFFHKTKNGFNPSQEAQPKSAKKKETNVEIGRYIRWEDTPGITNNIDRFRSEQPPQIVSQETQSPNTPSATNATTKNSKLSKKLIHTKHNNTDQKQLKSALKQRRPTTAFRTISEAPLSTSTSGISKKFPNGKRLGTEHKDAKTNSKTQIAIQTESSSIPPAEFVEGLKQSTHKQSLNLKSAKEPSSSRSKNKTNKVVVLVEGGKKTSMTTSGQSLKVETANIKVAPADKSHDSLHMGHQASTYESACFSTIINTKIKDIKWSKNKHKPNKQQNNQQETRTNLVAPASVSDVVPIPPPPPPPSLWPTMPVASTTRPSVAPSFSLQLANTRHDMTPTQYTQDQITPKDSESSTPQSHRIEGGLIFARPKISIQKDIKIQLFTKDERTRALIRTAIEKNDFLNNYMDKERKEMVIDAMEAATYAKGSFIIHENEEGSEIFVSEEGYYDVIKSGEIIGTLGPATVFGELAILYNAKRFASIKAATKARVWRIDRVKFRNIMLISGSREREENLNFLRSSPILKDLSTEVLAMIVDLLQRKFYETNTCIVRQGEVGNEFFIIRGGSVTIKKKNEYGVERIVDRRKRGDFFGEQALLNADTRQASVYADAPGAECLKLDRETFISYLGTIPQLREKPVERPDEGRVSNRSSEFNSEYADIELGDLKKVATLGTGAFGRVDFVTHNSGKTFALKIIKKIDVISLNQVEHIYNEKRVMMACRSSPFIVELYKTFRNDKYIYFLMEACMGGDVWTVMSQKRFFDEKTARFISACVVEAFDFLHSHNIIYRDLKPENLMLTTDGYCKLVDFGFAKRVPLNQKTNTFAGTPEYVAPEIILDRGHDRSIDYWALGILVFELLVGKTPFRGQNQIKIYQQILGGIDVIQMPSKIPKTAQGLIKNLCKQMPAERLGYQRRGILDIKRHSWFDNFDWVKLRVKNLPSPIRRPINHITDLQYFAPCSVDNDDPPDETSGWDVNF